MISEVGYIISEFGYDIRLVKSYVTTLYGFMTQMAPHNYEYYSPLFNSQLKFSIGAN